MQERDGIPVDVHRVCALADGSFERLVEIRWRWGLNDLQLYLQRRGGWTGLLKVGPMEWVRRNHQDGDAADRRYSFLEQFQLLAAESPLHERLEPGDVPARASKA